MLKVLFVLDGQCQLYQADGAFASTRCNSATIPPKNA